MKKLGILFVIFVGLALFVYFHEIRGREQREKAQELEESLFRLEEDQILSVEITRPGEEAVLFEKEGEVWFLKRPIESSVDNFAVDELVRSITQAKRERTLEDVSRDPAPYGLDQPRLTLRVKGAGQDQVLRIGKEDFTGSKVYAQFQDDPDVHLSGKALLSSADKQLFDWRSKSVVDFEQDKVQRIEIVSASGKMVLEKEDEEWFLREPIDDGADAGKVSELLSSLKYARVERFVSEQADDLRPYGLHQPQVEARVREEGQESWKILKIGNKDEEVYLAKRVDRPTIFTVQNSLVEDLTEEAWSFRNLDVVNVEQDEVDRFLLRRQDEDISIHREGSDWKIDNPEAQQGKETFSYRFWSPVSGIQFESLEEGRSEKEDPRFEGADITLELVLKDGSQRLFQFVAREEVYWARQLETGRHGTVSKEDYEKLLFKAESLVSE